MKIKDLIEKLGKFDENRRVCVWVIDNFFEIESVVKRLETDYDYVEPECNGEALIRLKELK